MSKKKKNKTVIILVGPTASGKTSLAIQLAKHFHTEIISADSRQCFKELNIGVARPTADELKEIPHHFIASHSVQQNVTAANFEKYALKKVEELFQQYDTVIMTGGTGLYIKAFCEGLDAIPDVPAKTREKMISKYNEKGLEWLQKKIKKEDPKFYKKGEIQNPQRLMRALEVVTATGKSILKFRKGKKAKRNFKIIKIGLQLPKDKLYENINARVDRMMAEGLLDEVKTLLSYKNLNALQTVGYKELFEYLEGKASLQDAIESIKKNTRHYAKRQMTWFKKDKNIAWITHPANISTVLSTISYNQQM